MTIADRDAREREASLEDACLRAAVANYLQPGGDFNGMPLSAMTALTEGDWHSLQAVLIALVEASRANIHWEGVDGNPHINRVGFAPTEAQLGYLRTATEASYHACLFPSENALDAAINVADYARHPYTLELARGAAQLAFRSFDLQVLEAYRNDPRYHYDCSDVGGSISISTQGTEGAHAVRESDQVLVQTFGFSYDDEGNRYVAAFLRYLHDLSGEHQLLWRARQSSTPTRLHPDYFNSSILGSWDLHLPLLQALCIEIWLINQMAKAMCGKPLFRADYGEYGEDRPKKLALLIRPTLEEFNAGVHLLDKVLSENISKDFFKGVLALEVETPRSDGKIVVTAKGTLALLDEYLRSVYRTSDWSPWDAAMTALRKVRKLRQQPAHAMQEDAFDPKYARDFKELCVEAYTGLATLRNCLQRHPAVIKAGITVPQDLEEGRIWTL